MLRIITAVVAVVAAIIYLGHQKVGPSPIKLSGAVDCASGEVNFSKGPLKGMSFDDMRTAMQTLARRGYSGRGLEQLPKIFQEACDGRLWNPQTSREDLSRPNLVAARYSKSSSSSSSSSTADYSVLRLVKTERGFTFDLFNIDLKKHGGSLLAYAQSQGTSRNCKQTSYDPPAACYKCENPLEVWCETGSIKG